MSESDILPEGPSVNLTESAAEVEETVTQAKPDYHEDEDAELHMAIRMSLEEPDAETTDDTMGDNMPIDEEEQAEVDQALFLSNLPPYMCDEQLAVLHQARVNGAKSAQDAWELVHSAKQLLECGEPDAVSNVMGFMQQAVGLAPEGSNLKASLVQGLSDIESKAKVNELHSSAIQLMELFQQSGDWTAIDNAVELMEEVIKLTPDGHADKAERLNNLRTAFSCRFERLGKLKDIENAIDVKRQAVNLTPDGHADKAGRLNNLGNAFQSRFECLGKLKDIENAIHVMQQAVDLTPDGHAGKAGRLNNLGTAFSRRFECLGELKDIENAIHVKRQAVDLTPDGHADKAALVNNLGNAFQSRFERLGELKDIENAIDVKRQAVNLTPDGHADKAALLNNLGSAFQSRFERLGELKDIENAIHVKRQAVDLTPDGHADKARWLDNLGSAFQSRFEHLGELKDIENAIHVNQQAVDLTLDGHAGKAGRLNNLGTAFLRRFERLGELKDIENAIHVKRQAVDLTPDGHADKAGQLNNLGNAFSRRFERLGELKDIENAIDVKRQAVNLTPDGHADKAGWLNNLGNAFSCRFERLGELKDIENAIDVKRQAVDLTPDGHADKAALLNNLGNAFQSRFERLGELKDIENAIDIKRQAVDLTPEGHAYKAGRLNNLGIAFQSRFEHLGELKDIENAIDIKRQAVDLTPDGHAGKAALLSSLGNAFSRRFERLGELKDITEASVAYKQAAENTSSRPSTRYSPSSALDAYTAVLEIIPQVVWFGQTVHQRYEELPKIGQTINAAAAMAISAGDLPRAVEWLEEGRSIVWKQLLQLRTPLDELHQQYPDIANELSRVSQALDNAGTSNLQSIDSEIKHKSAEEEAQNHRDLAARYEKLLQEVRELDGFSNFLRPKKFSELGPAARNGPVVVVNVADLRCDALVLCTSGKIVPVPLPTFSYKQAEMLCFKLLSSLRAHNVRANRNEDLATHLAGKDNQDHFGSVLADLWSYVVQPILSKIEQELYENAHYSLPHITWCATGALAFLPLHAAGIYMSDNLNINISDCAVSSYTTTLTAMLSSSSKPKRDPTAVHSVLIVSQPATPGQEPLHNVSKEVEAIQRYTSPDHTCHLTHESATVWTVLEEMCKHEIIHLACHGIQEMGNPLSSAFYLYDGGLDLNTLMKLPVSLENAELAVLSACQTATGDENLPEEAVHLAAGMLAVGYPSVIATMWSIGDSDAPLIADKVYANLLGRHDDPESQKAKLTPAYALHEAVKHLRKEVGETNFVRWVPFIHFGV
ncbi:hypothetical protein K435DRAFT_969583 [Dendrothele bispora CBS 962.96]|uniref:CHAT domain-containing protein n=1 Tax=Dendrothele bispora (strain CBS 962.96) TaxID=1314807 RepID=A0A4V4HDR6_DENBC|nr:hypothetical protein K435DRAFT_969583 [Dendrothele bispora CBS 962.96]